MINREHIQQQLDQWLVNFVEANHEGLNNWPPCPYARSARLRGLIATVFAEPQQFKDAIYQGMQTLADQDVVVICFDHHNIDPQALQEFVEGINRDIMPQDFVVLDDHPHSPEYVNGVCMNFGVCGLLLLQRLSKLTDASQRLQSQGYYNAWDAKALAEVVTWRSS